MIQMDNERRDSEQQHKRNFLQVAMSNGILQFGSFTLKSGRVSPYFFNAGLFSTGHLLAELAKAYAITIIETGLEFDVLFGPAYKGIPLAAITALKLAEYSQHWRHIEYAFNRKEAKDHGEGGAIVGRTMRGKRVLIIDDVITAGTAVREAFSIVKANGAEVVGVITALDRGERADETSEHSAIEEVRRALGVQVYSIIAIDDIIQFTKAINPDVTKAVEAYQARYASR